MNPQSKIENPRGAPRGNHNALKHGFYSRLFNTRDKADLSETRPGSVDDEIALLRVTIRRLLESSRDIDDFVRLSELNRGLCLATLTLARLIRIKFILKDGGKNMEAFDQAVFELFGDRPIFQDPNSPAFDHPDPSPYGNPVSPSFPDPDLPPPQK